MEKQFKYKLKNPISIDKDGKVIEASELIVNAPLTTGDDEFALTLEAEYKKSLKELITVFRDDKRFNENQSQEIEKPKDNFASISEMMLMTGNNLMISFYNLRELLVRGNTDKPQCTIGNTKMTKPLFDKISIADKKEILGRYITLFLS
jgi:hypothetical protein